MEYTFDFSTDTLVPDMAPELINSYFPGPGGPTGPAPVDVVYENYPDPLTGDTFTLNMLSKVRT